MQILTPSRQRAWRKCARFERIRYQDGYVQVALSEPMHFGTLFHDMVANFWRGLIAPAATGDPYLDARLDLAFTAYRDGWADAHEYAVLAIEAPYEAPMVNPDTFAHSRTFRLAGVIDLLLKDASGAVILVEHKTTSEDISDDGAPYWRRLAMDSQLSHYVAGALVLGHEVTKIIYDVTARPGLKPLLATPSEARKFTKDGRLYANQRDTDETSDDYRARLFADLAERPARYFRRRETARLESEVRDGLLDTWADGRMLRESQLAGRAPRNPDACHAMGTCEYWEHCALGVALAESDRWKRVTGAGIFPELPAALVVGATEMREEG